jgi:hypothetical protein
MTGVLSGDVLNMPEWCRPDGGRSSHWGFGLYRFMSNEQTEQGRTLFVVENQGIGIPAKELRGGNITVSSEPGGITRFCVSL